MKKIIVIVFAALLATNVKAQTPVAKISTESNIATTTAEATVAEASCGECNFGMQHTGCSLAVRIDGKAYLVEGAKLDHFGDAHAKDGMCSTIRKAEVTGEIKGDKYVAQTFKLLPAQK